MKSARRQAVPDRRPWDGEVALADVSSGPPPDKCPADSRPQLPPAVDRRDGDTHVNFYGIRLLKLLFLLWFLALFTVCLVILPCVWLIFTFDHSGKNCLNYFLCCRNYVTLHGQTKQLENDNEQMENRLKELKIAMGQEKAQREYGPYLFTYKSAYIKERYYS